MLERLTEDSYRALVVALAVARQDGRGAIEPEHLLKGLLSASTTGVSADWRAGRAVEPIPKVSGVLKVGPAEQAPGEIGLSRAVQRAINEAAHQADGFGHLRILPEHLLLALLLDTNCAVAPAAREAGVELEALIDRLRAKPQ